MTEMSSSFVPDFVPEFTAPELLTPATFDELVIAARSLHEAAVAGHTYGSFEIGVHTPHHTEMSKGRMTDVKQDLVLDDLPTEGVLIQNILISPGGIDGTRLIHKNSIWLNNFVSQTKILREATPVLDLDKQDDPHKLITRILVEGVPLDESNAKEWVKELNELQNARSQSRESKISELIHKLQPWRW